MPPFLALSLSSKAMKHYLRERRLQNWTNNNNTNNNNDNDNNNKNNNNNNLFLYSTANHIQMLLRALQVIKLQNKINVYKHR